MKNTEPIDDQIQVEAYVLGKMSEAEKASFQFRLMQNKVLRQKVATMRALHKTVIAEGQIKVNNHSKKSWLRSFLIALSLLMLIGTVWLGYQDASKSNNPSENTITIPPLIQKEIKTIEKNEPQKENRVPSKEGSERIPPPPQKSTPSIGKDKKSSPPLIAALNPEDFTPNPYLEEFIAGVRSNEIRIDLKKPSQSSIFKIKNNQVQLTFTGTLYTKKKIPLRLLLFSNKSADFDNNRPVLKTAIPLTKTTDGFAFSKAMLLELPKGLFYYIIENEIDEVPISIGKIRVE